MNLHKVLLGALLLKSEFAPYVLPSLEIEHFPSDLQPVFAAVSGSWNATGRLDAVEICARYPEQKEAIIGCVAECESECIAITRDRVEEWTQLAREQAALARVQGIAVQIANSLTTFADLPDLYSQMGEALTLDREAQDFKPIGELVDNYVRKLDEKPRYIPTGLSVLDKHLHLSPGNLFIIGGRPSAGKTALSLQMACEQARKGYRVCYFSLETDPDTLTARIIANRLAVPLADVKAKSVPQSDLDDLAKLHKLPLFISYTILLTSTKSLYDKAPRPRQCASEGFASFCGCFPCRGFCPRSGSPGGQFLHGTKTKGRCISATAQCQTE